MASRSRKVAYGTLCVLDARTNSGWVPLGSTAGRMGAATNQGAEEGYRVVRSGRISARNSAPGVGMSPDGEKKANRNLSSRLVLRMSGRLDSNQRPPEPHRECGGPISRKIRPFRGLGLSKFLMVYKNSAIFQAFLCPTLPFSGRGRATTREPAGSVPSSSSLLLQCHLSPYALGANDSAFRATKSRTLVAGLPVIVSTSP